MHKPLLFSLHPRWAELVFSGAKTLEIRRRFAATSIAPTLAYVHETGKGGGVVGSVVVRAITHETLDDLRGPLATRTRIPTDLLDTYLAGRTHGVALELHRPSRFTHPIPLRELQAMGLTPPQLFTWLPPHLQAAFHGRSVGAPTGGSWRFTEVDLAALAADDPLLAKPRSLYPGFDAWFAKAQTERRPSWGVLSNGHLRALAIASHRADGSVKLCTFLCLEPGMGSFFLPRVLATLGTQGVVHVWGEVLRTETSTLRFFERAGFATSHDPDQPHSWRVTTTLS